MKGKQSASKEERKMILEMIEASWDLAEQLGKHPVTKGCNCLSCVNGRKRLISKKEGAWKYEL
jgi:hypothetical protein